jgi:hypothetical protein
VSQYTIIYGIQNMSIDQTNSTPTPPEIAPVQQAAPQVAPPKAAVPAGNPLSKYFRQPAIYFGLPSGGSYWPNGSLEMPETGELPVYPLTSRDEITLRTPDALINGQGVVDVIQSCIPGIKDAWKMPAGDVDAVLIAIRIASYSHNMDFEHKCPKCSEENTYTMDLRHLMSTIKFSDYDTPAEMHGLVFKFRPSTYKEITELNQINYEITRTTMALENASDEDRKNGFTASLNKLVNLGQEVLARSTESVTETESGTVITDQTYIREFYAQIDAKLFNALQDVLTEKTKDANIKPVPVNCQSCNEPIQLTILFDYSNFFVVGS